MFTKVECYAGYKGEQTPRAIVLGDRRITVDDVLDHWLGSQCEPIDVGLAALELRIKYANLVLAVRRRDKT